MRKIRYVFPLIALTYFGSVSSETLYFHNDHAGTPQALTNENGVKVWEAAYTPFGKAEILIEEVEMNLRQPGQYFDKETELHYNYFRSYDPVTGRYVESDPIGIAGGLSTYGYVNQDPIGHTDPFGLSPASFAVKMGAKKIGRGTLNNYVETQIKGKITKIGNERLRKRFNAEAMQLDDVLNDPWWWTAIGFVPVIGDACDFVRVPGQIKKAFSKAELLEQKIAGHLRIQGQLASSLIKPSHKRGDGYPKSLESKTYNELLNMTSADARTMRKLIEQTQRLDQKY